jgi:hypothetical protein
MRRVALFAALLLPFTLATGCITVSSFTPGSDSEKGVWISKGRSFGPIQLSDPEILYCQPGKTPSCTAAKQNSALSGVSVEAMGSAEPTN